MAGQFDAWLRSLTGDQPAERYFTHPDAFPLLLLPWWLEASLRGSVDVRFQRQIVYSSIAGYYFVRVVDDAMDARATTPASTLPALIVLHAEFQHTLAGLFPSHHPFWTDFFAASYEAAETASLDASATTLDRHAFLAVSSRKVAGAKIPLAAVAHRWHRGEVLPAWSLLVEAFGRWHQMRNDVFDWRRDLERGTATYFLGEAARRTGSGGAITPWVLHEGLDWAKQLLDGWMDEVVGAAAGLGSPTLLAYLEDRRRRGDERWQALRESVAALDQLSARLRASQRSASASDQPFRRA